MSTMSEEFIQVPIQLAVDDKTRHWTYFRGTPRTEAEREASIHKESVGGESVVCQTRIYNGRRREDLTLDDASFELVDCPTALSTDDFYAL